jgi:type 2A phosphatase activator TIP41
MLARQDIPILFFDEVPLFEDELGDNGIAELVVRVVGSLPLLSLFSIRD